MKYNYDSKLYWIIRWFKIQYCNLFHHHKRPDGTSNGHHPNGDVFFVPWPADENEYWSHKY